MKKNISATSNSFRCVRYSVEPRSVQSRNRQGAAKQENLNVMIAFSGNISTRCSFFEGTTHAMSKSSALNYGAQSQVPSHVFASQRLFVAHGYIFGSCCRKELSQLIYDMVAYPLYICRHSIKSTQRAHV